MELAVVEVESVVSDVKGDSIRLTITDGVGQRGSFAIYIDSEFEGIDWDKLREWAREGEFVNIALVKYEG